MRIAVASDIDLGSHRAHAINVVKTAGGFARIGHPTRALLRAPKPGIDPGSAAAAYAEPALAFELAPALPPAAADHHPPARQRAFAAWAVGQACAWRADILYARHFETALAAADAGIHALLETHAYIGDTNPALARALEATRTGGLAITTISPALRDHYIERGGDPDAITVTPDGVDLDMFAPSADRGPSPFPRTHRAHALYAGHLYDYKGIPTTLEAAAILPEVAFELVGGAPEDIERTADRIAALALPNIRLHGLQAYREVPRWLWHADALLLPPSAREPSAAWTSPVKLGEYLAAGPPIVASRIPGLTTWVDAPAVRWFEPDNPRDLSRAMSDVLAETPAAAQARRAAAAEYARGFSYQERARRMLAALRPTSGTVTP